MLPGAEIVSVAVPEPVTLFTDSDAERPVGKVVSVRPTVPEKPSKPVTVIVAVHDELPAATVTEEGLEDMSKSGPFTITKMRTDPVKEGVVPVTVIEKSGPGVVPLDAVTVRTEV